MKELKLQNNISKLRVDWPLFVYCSPIVSTKIWWKKWSLMRCKWYVHKLTPWNNGKYSQEDWNPLQVLGSFSILPLFSNPMGISNYQKKLCRINLCVTSCALHPHDILLGFLSVLFISFCLHFSVDRGRPPCQAWEQGLFLLPLMCLARTSLERSLTGVASNKFLCTGG